MDGASGKGVVRHAGLPLPTTLPTPPPVHSSGQASLLEVPVLDAALRSNEALAALEQLYAVYKVEHWACVEELRTLHSEFEQAGGKALEESAVPGEAAAADCLLPAEVASAASFRDLLQALHRQQQGVGQGTKAPGNGDAMDVDNEQQQQQPTQQQPTQQQPTQQQLTQQQPTQQPQASHEQLNQQQPLQGDKQEQREHLGGAPSNSEQGARKYGDEVCGYGGADEPPSFSAVEDAVLGAGPLGTAAKAWARQQDGASTSCSGSSSSLASAEQLQTWRERFGSNVGGIAALERIASASSALFMDAQGSLACLCGHAGRYLIRRTAVTIGRSTDSKGDVDIDLAREGPACKVSRQQAQLSLGLDGAFSVLNVGRRGMIINGAPLERGDMTPLPHLSLLEVGGVQLLFLVNTLAVQRALVRSEQLVM